MDNKHLYLLKTNLTLHLLDRMNVEVLVITLIGVVLSTDTCTYINQNKNLVQVSLLSDDSNNGNTQEYVLNVGQSLSIRFVKVMT